MSKEIDILYKKAYTEVSTILGFLPKKEYEKIPKDFINLIEENKLEEYKYHINSIDELDKEKISYEAQMILLVIYNSYLASEEDKKRIDNILIDNEKKHLEEINEKYNPNNLFKQKDIKININEQTDKISILPVKYHETLFSKIISLFKRLFRKGR